MQPLTLSALLQFDPRPVTGPRQRFLCPFCGEGKPKDTAHRCLSVEPNEGLYRCHRCGRSGKFGREGQATIRNFRRVESEPAKHWSEALQESLPLPLKRSPGSLYLQKRGIPYEVAHAAGVRFAKRWYGRPAVMFLLRDLTGNPVAVQGRYIDGNEPKTRSCGPVKSGIFATAHAWDGVITIAEAPIDAMSLASICIPALATCGCRLPDWMPRAVRGRHVVIATDADDAGDKAAAEWMEILQGAASIERLRPTRGKDWNEELLR